MSKKGPDGPYECNFACYETRASLIDLCNYLQIENNILKKMLFELEGVKNVPEIHEIKYPWEKV